MTNNRFHFGIGVNPWYEDFLATGERWRNVVREWMSRCNIRGLMGGDYFGFKVTFMIFLNSNFVCSIASVPILIGGHSKLIKNQIR